MSLQFLGISHFPVLHRQFSSPTSRRHLESSPEDNLAQDNKDVLIERLNDLVARLSRDRSLENSTVTAIHSQVEQIEVLMPSTQGSQTPTRTSTELVGNPNILNDNDLLWGLRSPTHKMNMRLPDISGPPPRYSLPEMTPAKATELARAAEDLASQLSATLVELQARKEESDVSVFIAWHMV